MRTWLNKMMRACGLEPMAGRWLGRNRFDLCGRDNSLHHDGAVLVHTSCVVAGNGNRIELGQKTRLTDVEILVDGHNHRLSLGAGCRLRGKIKLEDSKGEICVGDGTTMEDAYLGVYDKGTRIIIGKDCMFSEHVGIRAGDMHSIIDVETGKRINPSKDIIIGDHVWLGRGATVLKGARIGSHSVIGAHSVVTGDIPEHSLAVGIPAKVIRRGVTWSRDRLPVE